MEAERVCNAQRLEEVAIIFKALADPNRLRILDVLMQAEACNRELNHRLGLPANLLSHHLRALREAGLISGRRDVTDGRWIHYAVDKRAVIRWRRWFEQFFDPARTQPR